MDSKLSGTSGISHLFTSPFASRSVLFRVAGQSRHVSAGQLPPTVGSPGVPGPAVRYIPSIASLVNPGVPSQVAMPITPPVGGTLTT